MKLRIGDLYQLKLREKPLHPYNNNSTNIIVYQIRPIEKLLESFEFAEGTPVLIVGEIGVENFVECLIQDKVYEVYCDNLIKLK